MHLRRFPEFAVPAEIVQLVKLVEPWERDDERAHVLNMPALSHDDGEGSHRHLGGEGEAGLRICWEKHSEASTTTLIQPSVTILPESWAGLGDTAMAAPVKWAEAMPGAVVRATRIRVVADEKAAEAILASAGFLTSDLVSCQLGSGARIWTDFRIHDDNYGRLVIAANGMLPGDLARCVQRLQELGNYRNLALLGLPVAQTSLAKLDALEKALDDAGRAQSSADQRDDDLLMHLSELTWELLSVTTQCGYRMNATAAYAEIVASRLAELDVRAVAGFPSLLDFTSRRFKPAVRTCATLTARLDMLNERAERFTAMLRTRIDTRIENQNARLLASLDNSAKTQLRLQHMVEGLSTVAISYYALGLLSYPVKALGEQFYLPEYGALGIAMPFVVLCVFFFMNLIRRRLTDVNDS